jgi:hypothetical protein
MATRIGTYLANFGLAKTAAYFGPLLLAAVLDGTTYGSIEYAWSYAALIATVVTAGIPAAVPQLSLLRRPVPVADILMLCVAAPGAALTAAASATLLLKGSAQAALILAACCIALAQIALAAYCRTFSHRNLALWFETLLIYVIAVIALGLALIGHAAPQPLAIATTAVAAAIVIVALTLFARMRQPDIKSRTVSSIGVGLPLLAFTLLSIWASVSGRVYLGAFLTIEDVSVYSVDFRIASVLLVVHSIIATALFARLYNMPTRLYDRFLSLYLAGIGLSALLLILLFPRLAAHINFRSIGPENLPVATSLFPVIMLQVYAWGGWASLEMRLARSRRSALAAWRTIFLMAGIAVLVTGLGIEGLLTLKLCASLTALQMLGGVAIQFLTLWWRGLKMPLSATAFAVGAIVIGVWSQLASN